MNGISNVLRDQFGSDSNVFQACSIRAVENTDVKHAVSFTAFIGGCNRDFVVSERLPYKRPPRA
jgi:hypothetical protein